jgi:hypothetical protein
MENRLGSKYVNISANNIPANNINNTNNNNNNYYYYYYYYSI